MCGRLPGSKQRERLIRAKLKKILAWHTPLALPHGAAEKIEVVLRGAEGRGAQNDKREMYLRQQASVNALTALRVPTG